MILLPKHVQKSSAGKVSSDTATVPPSLLSTMYHFKAHLTLPLWVYHEVRVTQPVFLESFSAV